VGQCKHVSGALWHFDIDACKDLHNHPNTLLFTFIYIKSQEFLQRDRPAFLFRYRVLVSQGT
jgi:hypothetical protein